MDPLTAVSTAAPALPWMRDPADTKVRLAGTDRARSASETWRMAEPVAARVGVTRVADVTRLDTIGIPTFQAIRPLSRTLAVSLGKGVTPELARLSALMESIEMWHVEQPLRSVMAATPREVAGDLRYSVEALPTSEPSLLHDGLPLAWAPARSLVDGRATLVPAETVALTLEERQDWSPPVFLASTNGLASGNTLAEAILHGLYEVIERDAVAAMLAGDRGVVVDPATAGSPLVDHLCALIEQAGVVLEVRHLTSPAGLPCYLSWVACTDYPAAMFGFGCHLSTEIALTRAITEAAQTRLAYVAGARDDLEGDIDGTAHHRDREPGRGQDLRDMDTGAARDGTGHDTLAEDLADVVRRATTAFGHDPLVVDLTREEIGVPVVKVVAPGARVDAEVL